MTWRCGLVPGRVTTPGRCTGPAYSRCSKATCRRARRCSSGPRSSPPPAVMRTSPRMSPTPAASSLPALETSRTYHESALAGYQRTGFSEAFALSCYARLASACLLGFEIDRAIALCEEYLRHCDELGEQWGRGTALWVRGAGRWLSGDTAAAIADALACLRIKETLGDLRTIAMSFDLLSACLVTIGDFDRAAVLSGASDRLWTILRAPVPTGPAYAEIRSRGAGAARQQLGGERYETARRRGAALPL